MIKIIVENMIIICKKSKIKCEKRKSVYMFGVKEWDKIIFIKPNSIGYKRKKKAIF